jgi:tRNA pseudouridine38-40 synthase
MFILPDKKHNIKVVMSYSGERYHGFQKQQNALGIQTIIEELLGEITTCDTPIYGCSRTDKGVHAKAFFMNFHTDSDISPENFVKIFNNRLPADMAVMSAEYAPMDFHARYSCTGKEYYYLINNASVRNPFMAEKEMFYDRPIDCELIRQNSDCFIGTHDFKSFCGTNGLRENTVRTIHNFEIEKNENYVKFTVSGDGFLYNMIRIMVGTLLDINEGRKENGCIPRILEARDRKKAGRTVPPYGLYLNRVFY